MSAEIIITLCCMVLNIQNHPMFYDRGLTKRLHILTAMRAGVSVNIPIVFGPNSKGLLARASHQLTSHSQLEAVLYAEHRTYELFEAS